MSQWYVTEPNSPKKITSQKDSIVNEFDPLAREGTEDDPSPRKNSLGSLLLEVPGVKHIYPAQTSLHKSFGSVPTSLNEDTEPTTRPRSHHSLRGSTQAEVKGRSSGFVDELPQLSPLSHKSTLTGSCGSVLLSGEYDSEFLSAPSRHSYAVDSSREKIVNRLIDRKSHFFTKFKPISVYCATWNVNGKHADGANMQSWLAADVEPPDIYAVGYQELTLEGKAYVVHDTSREDEWYKATLKGLNNFGEYHRIKLVRLVGMMLVVFVRTVHSAAVRDIASSIGGTGLFGRMGNKGGVAVRFTIYDTSVCFVNSHLAAHQDEVQRRNQDFFDINQKVRFHDLQCSIEDHDMIFWVGDCNYRIECNYDVCFDSIQKKDYLKLLKYDQLTIEKQKGNVFNDYVDALDKFHFQPTYKYTVGTNEFVNDEVRLPSWCDRILYKGQKIDVIDYRTHMDLMISDHKPVSAHFVANVKVIDQQKYRSVYKEALQEVDRLENESLPQAKLSQQELTFGDLKFKDRVSRSITVENTGNSVIFFEFLEKSPEGICKPWLTITPLADSIFAGEKAEITFEICIPDIQTLHKFYTGLESLEDVLVLHLKKGKDFFITISGNVEFSCFGFSIETLVHLKEPISKISKSELVAAEVQYYDQTVSIDASSKPTDDKVTPVPKEVYYLVNHIYKRGCLVDEIFEAPGLHEEIFQVRDCLDEGTTANIPGSMLSVAEALLVFLDSLPQPVIPYRLFDEAVLASGNPTSAKQIVDRLPKSHYNVFNYLTSFIRELLKHSSYNGLTPSSVASVFGRVLLKPPKPTSDKKTDESRTAFVLNFIHV